MLYEEGTTDGKRLVEYLEGKGYQVQYVTDPQTTIKLVRSNTVPVIVVVFSPSLEAAELCRALKEGDQPPAVIGLAERDLTHEIEAKLDEAYRPDQFFVRPFSFPQVLHAIEGELAGRESLADMDLDTPPLLFPQLLVDLWKQSKTGMLRVTTEGVQTTVYIKGGMPIFAEQGTLGDTLGRILIRSGRITEEQFSRAVDLITERLVDNEQLRLGEALIKLGFLTAEEVMEALRDQMQAKIIACFRHERFHSDFKEGEEHLEGVGSFESPFELLLLKGIKGEVNPMRLDHYLSPLSDNYPLIDINVAVELAERMGLTSQEQTFLSSIDGKKTLKLLRESSILDQVHASQVLTGLVPTDTLQLKEQALSEAEAVLPELEEVAEAPAKRPEQPKPEKPKPEPKRSKLRDLVMSMYVRIKGRPDWEQLEVSQNASQEEIEQAFATHASQLSIDTVEGEGDLEVEEKAKEIVQHLHQARDRMLAGTPQAAPPTVDEGEKRQSKLQAEKAFQRGKQLMLLSRWNEAAVAFRQASSLQPDTKEYRMFSVWLAYLTTKDKDLRKAARRDARNLAYWISKQDPGHAKAHLILGKLAMEEKKYKEADRFLQQAAQNDPEDLDVARELRLLDSRRKPGISLFKKK